MDSRIATIEDIEYIAAKMRTEDTDEILSIANVNVSVALKESFYASCECIVGIDDGKVFCVVGLIPDSTGVTLWMLFTNEVTSLPISFFKLSKKLVKQWLDKYGYLHNYTQKGNIFILKWLKMLDFNIEPVSLLGIKQIEVHNFWKRK